MLLPSSFEPPPRSPARLAALTAAGALVPAAILAATTGGPLLLAAIPAVTFGIPALTAPALYVGVSLAGAAPPPPLAMLRAVGRALIAFAITQLGLAVPAGFLVATASPATGHAIVACTVALAALVGVFRLRSELAVPGPPVPSRWLVEWTWLVATAAIAIRLYADVAGTVS